MELGDRKVLITGATGGIGHAIARACAAKGARLVLTGRQAGVLDALAAELRADAVTCDLADRSAVAALSAAHHDADIIIANAALPATGRVHELSEEQIDRMMEVNLEAPIRMARAAIPGMLERRSGHLVFISSLSGKTTSARSSMYNATKFGMRGFAGGLRADLHGTGVGVSTVFPGFIRDAGMFANTGAKTPKGIGTRTPAQVADATVRAIEKNRGEVDVAPLTLRLGTALAALAPEFGARMQRSAGGGLAEELAAAQVAQRNG